MSDSNLPTYNSAKSNLPTAVRQSRALVVGGTLAVGAAAALYVLTQMTVVAVLLGLAGVGFFAVRQLVSKSVALTTPQGLALSGSALGDLENIRKQVSKCKFLEHVETEGTLASEQATQLVLQYKNLQALLGQKFEVSEITYQRYWESIFSLCLAVGENLLHIKNQLENLNTMFTSSGVQTEWKTQRQQVNEVLQANQAGLSELASLYNALNSITTKDKNRDQLEQTMTQIRELADRAKNYSSH